MNVYISIVLFLLLGLFLFLALYDSGSTSTSSSSSTSTSTSTSLSLSTSTSLSEDVPSPNINMNLGASGLLTTYQLHFRDIDDNGVTGDLNATGGVNANKFCIDGICLNKSNFKALRHFVTGAYSSGSANPNIFTPYPLNSTNDDSTTTVGLVNLILNNKGVLEPDTSPTARGFTTGLSTGALRVSGYAGFQRDALEERVGGSPYVMSDTRNRSVLIAN